MNALMNRESSEEFTQQLDQLKDVLEAEKSALLQGDAKTVAALAAEKERLSALLKESRKALPETSTLSVEIKSLAGQVEELAALNHVLLKEVYQYYHGMVELLMRIAGGRGKTYGKNGYLNVDASPKRDREILA
jgi:flagellar biosynthesis/type III secretory pathway chaperone